MFRYERPQKGRLREFHQFGAEVFGQASVYEDANIIAAMSVLYIETNIVISKWFFFFGWKNNAK